MAVDFINLFGSSPSQPAAPVPYDVQMAQVKRRQAMADLLRKQANDPIEIQSSGGIQAPIPWTAILAKAIQGVGAGLQERGADRLEQEAREANRKQAEDLLNDYNAPAYHVGNAAVPGTSTTVTAPFPQLPGAMGGPQSLPPAPSAQVDLPGIAATPGGMGAPIPQQQLALIAKARMLGGPSVNAFADTYGPITQAQLLADAEANRPMSRAAREQAELGGDITRRNARYANELPPSPQDLIKNAQENRRIDIEANKPTFPSIGSPGYFQGGQWHPFKGGSAGAAAYDATGGAAPSTQPKISPQSFLGISKSGMDMLIGNTTAVPREMRMMAQKEADKAIEARGLNPIIVKPLIAAEQENIRAATLASATIDRTSEEILGTIESFKPVADMIGGNDIRWTKEGAQVVGQFANDATAQEYAFHLTNMREELAGLFAATSGAIGMHGQIQGSEQFTAAAENVIKAGLSRGGADGLAQAIRTAREKNVKIVDHAAEKADRRIWHTLKLDKEYDQIHGVKPGQTGTGGAAPKKPPPAVTPPRPKGVPLTWQFKLDKDNNGAYVSPDGKDARQVY